MTSNRGHDPVRGGQEDEDDLYSAYVNEEYFTSSDHDLDVSPRPGHSPDMESIDLQSVPRSAPSSAKSFATAATVPMSPRTAQRLRDFGPKVTEVRTHLTNATNEAGRVLAAGAAGARQVTKQGLKTLTRPMEVSQFGWFDALTALISIGMFYFDVASDILVAFYMFNDPQTHSWFLSTVLLLVIPLAVVNAFSLYWYWFDEYVCEPDGMCYRSPKVTKGMWAFRIIAHILLQASILRYVDLIYYGVQSLRQDSAVGNHDSEHHHQTQHHDHLHHNQGHHHQDHHTHSHHNKGDSDIKNAANGHSSKAVSPMVLSTNSRYREFWVHAERDAVNVDVLSSLVQDAPQLILQLYIMTYTIPKQSLHGNISPTLMVQLLSVGASLVAMAWSVGSFSKATRLAEPSLGNLSPAGLLFLSTSHFCSIAPQVLCFALFSSKYLIEFLVLVACHWLATSTLVLIQVICCPDPLRIGATFTHDIRKGPCSRVDDVAFSAAFGLIFLFTFVNVGGRAPKVQGGIYHALRLVEETCMLAFWYAATDGNMWYHWLPLVLVSLMCVLGAIFFSLYYYCANPDHRYKQDLTV